MTSGLTVIRSIIILTIDDSEVVANKKELITLFMKRNRAKQEAEGSECTERRATTIRTLTLIPIII